jgi:uncharacterized surface anchored protein
MQVLDPPVFSGAIKITKTSSKAEATPLAGAKFSITDSHGIPVSGSPVTTGSNGTACVDNLVFGTYTVTETQAPSGYAIDHPSGVRVSIGGHEASCTSGPATTPPPFRDTPLTDVSASATSVAPGGTRSTITCTGTSTDGKTTLDRSNGPKESANVSATQLHPGDYTCAIDIDP